MAKLGDLLQKLRGSPRPTTRMLLPLVAVAVFTFDTLLGHGGCVEIEPGEAAVIYNNTGVSLLGPPGAVVLDQGIKTFIPGLQTVEKLERRPQILVMADDNVGRGRRGSSAPEDDRTGQLTKKLTVRASDGSNFYFDRMEVHYQVIPSAAVRVLESSGPGEAFKNDLVATHAREILRDEFGRNSFIEVANPTTYGAATTEARRRLNLRLEPYGLEVTQIVTPKPKFEERVEKAIEDRQGAEQEIEVQAEKRRKLELESSLKVQAIEQEKNAEYQTLLADLEAQKKAAENKLLAVQREADKYFIERDASGRAYRDEKVTRAKANEVAYRKEAEGMVARVSAIGAQGPDVLNSVIAEHVFPQLQRVRATPVVPMSTPLDLRYISGGRPGAASAPAAPAAPAGGQ